VIVNASRILGNVCQRRTSPRSSERDMVRRWYSCPLALITRLPDIGDPTPGGAKPRLDILGRHEGG
jgi:hypothetical protein